MLRVLVLIRCLIGSTPCTQGHFPALLCRVVVTLNDFDQWNKNISFVSTVKNIYIYENFRKHKEMILVRSLESLVIPR